jgi:predicted dehydrogenase
MGSGACRIGILGLDHWYSALLFIPAFAREPRLEIAGIADRDPTRARIVASENGVQRVVAEPAELIADPTVDAVAIFTSTDANAGLSVAAARAGKHVISIKPMARTLDEATAVLEAVRRAGVTFMSTEAFGPGGRRGPVEAVRNLVAAGRLGEPEFARCSVSAALPRSWPDNYAPGWFADPARGAGGAWIDHAIYEIDRLRWVLGREVRDVAGLTACLRHVAYGVEDWGCALARFEGGVIAELRDDWYMPQTSMYQGQWELVGTKGVVRVDDVGCRVAFVAAPPDGSSMVDWQEVPVPDNFGAADAASHVADVLQGLATPLGGVEDAWRNLAFATAFYEAAKTGATVPVREVPKP